MNIKSLMLGSAAALVAVTGARAADPIIAVEADPVEYVRVCDVYGTGFFYIPGTETCLRISGYARLRYQVVGEQENLEGDDYTAGSRVRARVNFDAREETEYGTLRAFLRLQGTNRFGNDANIVVDDDLDDDFFDVVSDGNNSSATVEVDQAYLQLGGLTIGYLDSLWAERDGLLTDTDWSVGDDLANRISYTFTSEGFSAAVSLEDDGTGDFAPDVVGQLAYESGFFSAYVSGVYDEQSDVFGDFPSILLVPTIGAGSFGGFPFLDDFGRPVLVGDVAVLLDSGLLVGVDDVRDDDGAFALKAGASLKDLIVEGSELKIEGHYAFEPTRYAVNSIIDSFGSFGVQTDSIGFPIESQIGLGYAQPIGPFAVAVSGVVGETFDVFTFDFVDNDFDNIGQTEFYTLALNVGYEVTNNFSILGEVTYRDVDFAGDNDDFDDFDQTAGFVEFLRTF